MKEKDKQFVSNVVDAESFDYAFIHYSNFSSIKDKKFHQLREAYCSAREALAEYIRIEEDWQNFQIGLSF